jgi:chromate transporter
MFLFVKCYLVHLNTSLTLIGYKRGGIGLAILTLIIWILPACTLMGGLSFVVTSIGNDNLKTSVFQFIQPMAIGFLAYAGIKMFKLAINSPITQIIMLVTMVLHFCFLRHPGFFL